MPIRSKSLAPADIAAISLAVVSVLLFLCFSVVHRHSMAVGDYWVFVTQRATGAAFSGLFGQNEQHLMALPRFVFALDEALAESGFYLTFLIGLACLAGLGVLALATLHARSPVPQGLRCPLAGVVATFVFSASHIEVLTEPAKLWIPLSVALSAGAIGLAARPGGATDGAAVGAAVLIVAASASGLVGLFAIPVTLALALRLGTPPRRLLILGCGGAAAGLLFFSAVTLHLPAAGNETLLARLGAVPLSVAAFLGAPVERVLTGLSLETGADAAARAVGLAGIVLSLFFWGRFLAGRPQARAEGLWLGLVAFALLWGVGVGMRDTAKPDVPLSRYDLPVSLFWASLVVLAARTGTAARHGRRVGAVLLVALVLFPAAQIGFGNRASERAALTDALRLALGVGVRDPELNERYEYLSVLDRIAPTLKARGLPPFDAATVRALGTPAGEPADAPCGDGELAVTRLPDGGLRLRGTAAVPPERYAIRVYDAAGRLIGLGEGWDGFGPVLASPAEASWLAYVAPAAVPPLRVHVVANPPCLLGRITGPTRDNGNAP